MTPPFLAILRWSGSYSAYRYPSANQKKPSCPFAAHTPFWGHFSELMIFSQAAAILIHPQCHSNICDCCSLR